MTAARTTSLGRLGALVPIATVLVDGTGTIVDINPAACRLFGAKEEELRSRSLGDLVASDRGELMAWLRRCSASAQLVPGSVAIRSEQRVTQYRCDGALFGPAVDGQPSLLYVCLRPRSETSTRFKLLSNKIGELQTEVNLRRQTEAILHRQRDVLEAVVGGGPLEPILEALVSATQSVSPGSPLISILRYDPTTRRLYHGAGASLPASYRAAIDGVEIGPAVGSCGTAAFRNELVVVADIATDPLWADYREIALSHGLRSCWSLPVRGSDGAVVATFALYHDHPRPPTEEELHIVETMTRIASIAIERHNLDTRMRELLDSERSARSESERANRTKDEFLAMVSHELRNPLNAILGWIHVLRQSGATADVQKKGLEIIERNARLQAELISDVLDFSRIVTGRLTLDPEPALLESVIEKACESVRPEATKRELSLGLHMDRIGELLAIDASRLQQAISNLLWNAIKFTPSGGRIDVHLERKNGVAEVQVVDTGCGIAPDVLPRIFDRFQQADSSRSREHGGLGLGLAIVRHVVESHGGQVSAASDGVDKGSRFTLSIPMKRSVDTRVDDAETPEVRLDRVHVVAVDDIADARDLLQAALTRVGARVTTVASAEEALRALANEAPDILLCDIGLPGTDGYELIRKWRSNEARRTPAIALTAFTREIDRAEALEAGFDEHMPKPIEQRRLLTLIATLLGRN